MTYLGVLADTTEGSFKTHKGAFGSGNYGYRSRYLFSLAGVNDAKVQYRGPAIQMQCAAERQVGSQCWYPTGKRQRKYFETKEAALAEQAVKEVEVQNLGLRGLEISDRLRLEALDVQERLAGFGISLIQVVDDYIRRRGSPKTTVREVADIFWKSRVKHGRSKKHLDSFRRSCAANSRNLKANMSS